MSPTPVHLSTDSQPINTDTPYPHAVDSNAPNPFVANPPPRRIAPLPTRSSAANGAERPEPAESYESLNKRIEAQRVVESTELLIWYSVARGESIPQTRLHFQRIVAGLPPPRSQTEIISDDEDDGPEAQARAEAKRKAEAKAKSKIAGAWLGKGR